MKKLFAISNTRFNGEIALHYRLHYLLYLQNKRKLI